jgi:hypothetical protein
MVVKLKDILNLKKNKCNKQISFDLRKREMKKHKISVDKLMDIEIAKFKEFK